MANADSVLAELNNSEFNVEANASGAAPTINDGHPDSPVKPKQEEAEQVINTDGMEVEINGEKLTLGDSPKEGEEEAQEAEETPANEEEQAESTTDKGDALSEALADAEEIAEGLMEDEKLKAAGVDFDTVIEEFRETGKVSQETLDKAKEAGYSEKAIKSVLKGAAAAAAEVERQFFGKFGGQDAYREMLTWAASNADAEVVEAFNDAIDRGDMRLAAVLGKGIQRDQRAAAVARRGTSNKQVLGGGAPQATAVASGKAFASLDEMAAAMNDSRYMKDHAYTQMVRQKAAMMDGSFIR